MNHIDEWNYHCGQIHRWCNKKRVMMDKIDEERHSDDLALQNRELVKRNLELNSTLLDILRKPGSGGREQDMARMTMLEEFGGIDGAGLISDDKGHWAVSSSGFQSIAAGPQPDDVETSFFVEAGQWHKTIRGAIDAYLEERHNRGNTDGNEE